MHLLSEIFWTKWVWLVFAWLASAPHACFTCLILPPSKAGPRSYSWKVQLFLEHEEWASLEEQSLEDSRTSTVPFVLPIFHSALAQFGKINRPIFRARCRVTETRRWCYILLYIFLAWLPKLYAKMMINFFHNSHSNYFPGRSLGVPHLISFIERPD